MFGGILNFAQLDSAPEESERQLLPATPVKFPRLRPKTPADRAAASSGPAQPSLVNLLQSLVRPPDIKLEHFEALGVHVTPDAPPDLLVPDPSFIPDFAAWDQLTPDEAREKDQTTRRPLNNGALSPGCQVYLDRKRELSCSNEDAFRTVRRMQPTMGQPQVRLGNSYEYFRCLETFTSYWDDPTGPPKNRPPLSAGLPQISGDTDSKETTKPAQPTRAANSKLLVNFWPVGIGAAMNNQSRQSLLSAFLKLVAYDFGCNVSAARTEPRLQLTSPPATVKEKSQSPASSRRSYFPSGCLFLFRSPTTREAARAGVVEGPLAAVSARQTTNFDKGEDELVDLAREVIAALVTAQHRARQGKEEKRFGDGMWWATKPRWGGGPGGPIGREIDRDDIAGDKDEVGGGVEGGEVVLGPGPARKRAKKTLSVYDNYRMVRPPSANWDSKARYEPIGKQAGADHDDIFVISSLFHHVSIIRVRVPMRLLDVLDGASEDDQERSWGKLSIWRSRWFDYFLVEDRVAAMQLVWGMMAYQMRTDTGADGDVKMEDA